jgi:hypothetical protein
MRVTEVQNEVMIAVARLITFVDLGRHSAETAHASVSARHEAVLTDGRRLVIFDDRGWSWSVHHGGGGEGDSGLDPWASTSLEDIEFTARVVVGPDEPVRGRSQDEAATAHWAYVAGLLQEQGVTVSPYALVELPHDVVVSDVLRAHIRRGGAIRS